MFRDIVQDLRLALRSLRRRPNFTVTVILTLALGIGASTAMFTVVHAVLLNPVALEEPDRLVWVWSSNAEQEAFSERVSEANLVDYRRRQTRFAGLAAGHNAALTWSGRDQAAKLSAVVTTDNFFDLLGARPSIGRTFEPRDLDDPVVVLSHRFWRTRFAADPGVLGQTLVLDGEAHTVIGVLPADFGLPRDTADVFQTRRLEAGRMRHARRFWVLGRLANNVTLADAQNEMTTLAADLATEHPDVNRGWSVALTPLHEYMVREVRTGLWVIFGAVGLVLLIACGNVANLFLARAADRGHETAIQLALGAGRPRLLRRWLLESLMLAGAGGITGIALAFAALPALLGLEPGSLPRIQEITIDGRALAFAVATTLLTGIVSSLAPALTGSRQDLVAAIKSGDPNSVNRSHNTLRHTLVVAEVAFALMLLVVAGLLLRSFTELYRVDPGFRTERLAVIRMFLRVGEMPTAQRIDFFEGLERHLAARPGVESAGATTTMPLSRIRLERSAPYRTVEQAGDRANEAPEADLRLVTPGYLSTLEVPLRDGRLIGTSDRPKTQRAVVVNETLARRVWPNGAAVGQTLDLAHGGRWAEWQVVGVIGDMRYQDLASEPRPAIYLPLAQLPASFGMHYVVRTAGDPALLLPELQREILAFDPEQPAHSLTTVGEILAESVARERFASILMAIFAGLALVLAAVGIYAVLAYTIGRRTREIGLRMALGARPTQVFGLVFRNIMSLAAMGIGLGLAASQLSSRALSSLLYGISPRDPLTLAVVTIGIFAAVALATYWPARCAMAVEPLVALRHE